MKTRTLLIGALVAVGAAGVLWYVLKKRGETSTVVPAGTTPPPQDAFWGSLFGNAGNIITSIANGAKGIIGAVRDKDDQTVDPDAGYAAAKSENADPLVKWN